MGILRRCLSVLLVAVVGIALAGCGGSDDSTASDTPSSTTATDTTSPSATESATDSPTAPSDEPTSAPAEPEIGPCAEVWVAGATLPEYYRGCTDEASAKVKPNRIRCESGQILVTYADSYYAVMGGLITQVSGSLTDSRKYRKVVARCRG